MFACARKTLNLIFLFALMFNETVSIGIPGMYEFSRTCANNFLYMQRFIGKPPSQENYWDGHFRMDVFPGLQEITIRLKLIAPAEVSLLYDEEGTVKMENGEFVLTFFPKKAIAFHNVFKIHVQGEEGGKFPNVQNLTLNGDDVCPNPHQWEPTIFSATSSKKVTGVSNNRSKKDREVSNNNLKKCKEVSNTDTALKCGKRLVKHQGLIKGGQLTKEGDWPWHAAIFHQEGVNSYVYKCGGVLLNKNSVLTAAHCVVQTGRFIVPERVLVKLGMYHHFVGGRNVQEFEVYRIIPHENFNSTYLYNDIAMLKLSTEATYTNYVQPACVWPKWDANINSLIGQPGDVIGWGFYDKQNKLSEYLGYGTMPIVSMYTCLESNRPFFGLLISPRTFCAGYRNGTGVCNGDSGGGMFFERNGAYLLRGLVSVSVSLRNEQVCNLNEYVLFTDVAQYLDWIRPKL